MKKYLRAVILLLTLTCALGCAACRDTDAEAARADFAAGAETALPQETAAEAFDPAALSLAELAEWRDDAAVVAAWKDAHPLPEQELLLSFQLLERAHHFFWEL